jgi:N-acetylglucosaminyl-diphospho-decaprenol L-rhamnosyltransferase
MLRQCLDSVQGYEMVIVDHGSSDGTAAFIRSHYPEAILIEQENVGFAGGVNAGVRAAHGRYVLLLNPDAWMIGDAVRTLVGFADAHPEAGAAGPRLQNPDGSLQRSIRGFPTLWRLATQYLFFSRLGPRTRLLNSFYGGGLAVDRVQDVEFLRGACLLVRRAALDDVGPFDDSFFMFAEEADWCLRARRHGWRIVYVPDARAGHVGEATTRSVWSYERAFREQERSHLRFLAKHHDLRTASWARLIIIAGYVLRSVLSPRAKRAAYWRTATWLCRTRTATVLADSTGEAQ